MKKELLSKLVSCAQAFSTNKATQAAYLEIFFLIYDRNIVLKQNNEYGYAEINFNEFKAKSWRKYKNILTNLHQQSLIHTNIPLNKSHLGRKSVGGKSITRGYKIDDSVHEYLKGDSVTSIDINNTNNNTPLEGDSVTFQTSQSVLKDNKNMNNNSLSNISFNPFPIQSYPMGGDTFCDENGEYDVLKAYEYIDIDLTKVPYVEGSPEWNELAKKWNRHTPAYKNMNRIYSWFHSLRSEEREIFTLNGSHLREAFDVPACNFCIIAKLLEEKNVDREELFWIQNIAKHSYIYGQIAAYANIDLNEKNKKLIKSSFQHWLNVRKNRAKCAAFKDEYFNYIDDYFKTKYPSVYNELVNWEEMKHNNKVSKALWNDFQRVEFDIISKKMCNYLYKRYGVTPVTVHDALYLTDADRKKVPESIEDRFWKIIDYKRLKLYDI